ncbi:MAG: ABC transporter permease [Anaerolineae bacterium]|nr:ABC transporter permease [Anaerolineae bacterium]
MGNIALTDAKLTRTDAERPREAQTFQQQVKGGVAFVLRYSTVFVFIFMIIISTLLSPVFLSERNIFNLLRQVSGLGIVSMGMLLVILTGGIDLSVGSIAALGSVLVATFLKDMPLLPAVVLSLGAGLLMGAFSGFLVANRNMAPFVATLALMTVARGLAFMISKGSPVITENQTLTDFGSAYWLRIPLPVFVMFGFVLITLLVQRFTAFGRIVMAIGSNESAVRLAGIRVGFYKFAVYCISGILCVVAGLISTSRTGVGSPIVGNGMELDAIAAVVIGGASLSGGRGNAINTLLGVLILGMIGNIMNLMNIPGYPQQVIQGLIIVVAVLLQGAQARRAR